MKGNQKWSGLFSETLNWGLLVSSLGLMVLSLLALRRQEAEAG